MINRIIKFIRKYYPYFSDKYPERTPSSDLIEKVKNYLMMEIK